MKSIRRAFEWRRIRIGLCTSAIAVLLLVVIMVIARQRSIAAAIDALSDLGAAVHTDRSRSEFFQRFHDQRLLQPTGSKTDVIQVNFFDASSSTIEKAIPLLKQARAKGVYLDCCDVSGRHLIRLAVNPYLRHIILGGCNLRDADLFHGCRHLERIELKERHLSSAAVGQLRTRLPGCRVECPFERWRERLDNDVNAANDEAV